MTTHLADWSAYHATLFPGWADYAADPEVAATIERLAKYDLETLQRASRDLQRSAPVEGPEGFPHHVAWLGASLWRKPAKPAEPTRTLVADDEFLRTLTRNSMRVLGEDVDDAAVEAKLRRLCKAATNERGG